MPRAMGTPNTDAELTPLRARIDQIDQQLVELLNERARVVVDIGKVKRDGQSPIYAPDREQQVLQKVRDRNKGPLPDSCLIAMWRELMSGSFALERPLRIGYLGPPGSFSHLAARRKFGASVEYDDLEDIAGVFEEIVRGHIDLGLVPIENSSMGGIGETLDSFLDSPVQVYAEVLINIHHNLLANCPPERVTKVYSKPEVFAQCRRWLGVQIRNAERVPVASSSKAAELASKETNTAAIGSTLAAELYGLKVQFANIEDNPNNTTRFFIISKDSAKPTGDDKTAMMFTTAHKAGALAEVLDVFRDHKLNLTHIDKRPSKRVNWEYYFFIDCLGHQSDPAVTAAIEAARKHCQQLTILGSFPRAREVL
ncbi:MAG: prephenate dehydratase [Planctomycetes bacterium]|nr:prephenate dehydratase [Planctomycetota bacterium]